MPHPDSGHRFERLEALVETARQQGHGNLEPLLRRVVWPSILLRRQAVDDAHVPVGGAKFGGLPDLHVDAEWPRHQGRPLAFIAQIDLAAIAGYQPLTRLPAKGLLSFFYDAEKQPWGDEDDAQSAWRVLHCETRESLVRAALPPDLPPDVNFPARPITVEEGLTFPGMLDEPSGLPQPEAEEDEMELIDSWLAECDDDQPRHRMFGAPDCRQDGMHLESEFMLAWEKQKQGQRLKDEDQWRLLLQVDSDDEDASSGTQTMRWGDNGRLYFWINKLDLMKGDFSRVELRLQCA